MDSTEMTTALMAELKGLSSNFVADDYANAISEAERETWSLPVTSSFRILWFKHRAKRHLFFFLWTEYIDKIRHKETHFQQRFEHLQKMIEKMDEDFLQSQKDNPSEFADVDAHEMFGTYIRSGFRYDNVGRDVTYEDLNEAILNPNEVD